MPKCSYLYQAKRDHANEYRFFFHLFTVQPAINDSLALVFVLLGITLSLGGCPFSHPKQEL